MVNVGVLAMLVNVGVLVTVALADRALEVIVLNFAKSRLHRKKRAPVVHDSDTWLPNIPRSILKYRKHPAILTTVLCTVFLLASELITELGVDVAEMCTPLEKKGTVIVAEDRNDGRTQAELAAIAFFVHSVSFLDGELTRVTGGMPKRLTGKECLPCLYERNPPDVARDCSISMYKVYEANELQVGIETTDRAFGTITAGFKENGGDRLEFLGEGDLTGNGKKRATFVFAYRPDDDSSKQLLYFEYALQSHIESLKNTATKQKGSTVWENTQAPVPVWSIQCGTNELSRENFRETVMIYRTVQLENPTQLIPFDEEKRRFEEIRAEDVYRAILSLKIIVDDNAMGTYYEYTTCAYYKWQFLAPILGCLVIIITLGLLSVLLASRYELSEVPYNARSWFRHSQRASGINRRSISNPSRSGYFDSLYEEMVLVDGDNGDDYRILFRSRSSRASEIETSKADADIPDEIFSTPKESFDTFERSIEDGYGELKERENR